MLATNPVYQRGGRGKFVNIREPLPEGGGLWGSHQHKTLTVKMYSRARCSENRLNDLKHLSLPAFISFFFFVHR
jgi:hypothetical protein